MKVLGISGDEQKAFWLVLAAIYHLSAAGATKGKTVNPTSFPFFQQSSIYCKRQITLDVHFTELYVEKKRLYPGNVIGI